MAKKQIKKVTSFAGLPVATKLLLVVVVGALGTYALTQLHADSSSVSSQTESGTLSGNATKVTNAADSGGSAVTFGTASTSNPTGPTSTAPAIPTAVPSGFTRGFTEDFNTPAPLGSFASVYATNWGEYDGPNGTDGCCSTNGFTYYNSNKVISVSSGSMFYYLHSENGNSYAAAPQAWNYHSFLYGQVGMSVKLDSETGDGYKIAFLLWPDTNDWTNEVDFPEVDPDFNDPIRAVSLNTTTVSGAHNFSGPTDTGVNFTDGKYHTFLLTWTPGSMTASIDGKTVATFTGSAVPAQAMRLSLQAEGWINQGAIPAASNATVEVPWVYINTYN